MSPDVPPRPAPASNGRAPMAENQKSRNSVESRKSPRRLFHYNARISYEQNAPQIKCMITDVSKSGAQIVLESDNPLPDNFLLLFTPNGWPRRNCKLVWRDGLNVGVMFTEG